MGSVIQLFSYSGFSRLGQKIKSKVNQKFLTYLVFLLIAIAIWYLNALNEDSAADLKFAVKYTDMPEDKVLTDTPPEHLTLTVYAQGYILLQYRLGLIYNPISLEASYRTLRKDSNSPQDEYYLYTQTAFDRIAAQLRPDVTLRQVAPDTLKFLFSETIRKEVPVKPALQLQLEKDFLPRGEMLIKPAKVTVTGPKTMMDTMQYVYTKTKVFKRVKETLRISIDLQPVHQLRYSISEVHIEQAIERNAEATIVVPVEPVNLPEGLTMKVFPGTITLNCMVPVSDYEKMQPYMFRAVVDYMSVMDARDNQSKARVAIIRAPDYVTDVKFHPSNVDFIIEK